MQTFPLYMVTFSMPFCLNMLPLNNFFASDAFSIKKTLWQKYTTIKSRDSKVQGLENFQTMQGELLPP